MNQNRSRRKMLAGVFLTLLALAIPVRSKATPKYQKGKWLKLHDEPVRPGDMWSYYDPNTPELQTGGRYILQMQAVHQSVYGTPAKDIARGSGDYWRLVGIVDVF